MRNCIQFRRQCTHQWSLWVAILVTLFATACKRLSDSSEPNTNGTVSRLYKTITYSAAHNEDPALRENLRFVKVEDDLTVIMLFRADGRERVVRGRVGEALRSEAGITPFIVMTASASNQTATIEYLAWSSYPKL